MGGQNHFAEVNKPACFDLSHTIFDLQGDILSTRGVALSDK
jgi:hypothetical protein